MMNICRNKYKEILYEKYSIEVKVIETATTKGICVFIEYRTKNNIMKR